MININKSLQHSINLLNSEVSNMDHIHRTKPIVLFQMCSIVSLSEEQSGQHGEGEHFFCQRYHLTGNASEIQRHIFFIF